VLFFFDVTSTRYRQQDEKRTTMPISPTRANRSALNRQHYVQPVLATHDFNRRRAKATSRGATNAGNVAFSWVMKWRRSQHRRSLHPSEFGSSRRKRATSNGECNMICCGETRAATHHLFLTGAQVRTKYNRKKPDTLFAKRLDRVEHHCTGGLQMRSASRHFLAWTAAQFVPVVAADCRFSVFVRLGLRQRSAQLEFSATWRPLMGRTKYEPAVAITPSVTNRALGS